MFLEFLFLLKSAFAVKSYISGVTVTLIFQKIKISQPFFVYRGQRATYETKQINCLISFSVKTARSFLQTVFIDTRNLERRFYHVLPLRVTRFNLVMHSVEEWPNIL